MGTGSDGLTVLVKEINRIVSAPYPVLFDTLAHILPKIDDSYVYLWTIVKSCQVRSLVSRLLDSLNKDKAALSVLLRLIRNTTFRDEVLKQDPGVFKELFGNATEQKVLEACLAVFRLPSPEDVAVTIEYLGFIEAILANTRAEPIDAWVRQAHSVIRNLSITILSMINSTTIQKCISLWNEASKSAESHTFLRFASIASILYHLHLDNEPSHSCDSTIAETSEPLTIWVTKSSLLFNGPKAQKMLKSVLLHTLHAVADKAPVAVEGITNALEMARVVLGTFPQETQRTAIFDQDIIDIVTKIVQKSNSDSMPITARLAAAGFLLILDPECQIWDISFLHTSFTEILFGLLKPSGIDSLKHRADAVKHLDFWHTHQDLRHLLERKCFEFPFILKSLMQHLIALCHPDLCATLDTILCLQAATSLVSDIGRDESGTTNSNRDVFVSILAIEIPEWWNWSVTSISPNQNANCDSLASCTHVSKAMQNRLNTHISRIYLGASCTSGAQVSQYNFAMLCSVLEQSTPAREENACHWPMLSERRGLWPTDQYTSHDDSSQGNLEKQLAKGLALLQEQTADMVWKYTDRVCQDLQYRCQTVEAPLRVEQARSEELQRQLTDAKNASEVMLADHRARSLLWQHDLEVEQQEVAVLKETQACLERNLAIIQEQLDAELQKRQATELVTTELNRKNTDLQAELERDKAIIEESRIQNARSIADNLDLKQQLIEAHNKEQRLFRVLHGDRISDL